MRHLLAVCGALLILMAVSAAADQSLPGEVEQLLATRKVLATVTFSMGSASLDDTARAAIDRAAKELSTLAKDKALVRIEGFSSPEGEANSNISIAVMRARAVEDYLRGRHQIPVEIYLSGSVDRVGAEGRDLALRRRAEIALYDNIWQVQPIPVGQTILEWQQR
ncbi:hypothetical protein DESUT3_20860 [Desulfuromonas versatilis]|uniref:OmpA-like domain-containing protein n=1 Tax=Desulfuromonas versatilis TaxID=2802975 RepID=A0ABM8HWW0_9BACT|nr:OmpA family protein [Desulfuromonas versatilis]BCR05017.1 hypothetical protein DESUT3_20860 [Desulfuromonas versatilis]